MKKLLTICFRTNSNLREALEEIGQKERRSLSTLIENVLYDYMDHMKTLNAGNEKRRHPRKKVSLPAFITGGDVREKETGVIIDLSFGGIKISVPKESTVETWIAPLNILFALPTEKVPLTLRCLPSRIREVNEDTEVAATFADCDFISYQRLQSYLLS